jgi:branched-subunit amino acid permease
MKPHRFDLVALLFGLAFAGAGVLVLVHELTDESINGAWVAAIGFVALGVVALAATITRHARRSALQPEHPDA